MWDMIVKWSGDIQLTENIVVIIVGAIVYKFCGVIIGWLVHGIARSVHSREDKNERKKRLKTLSTTFTTVAKVVVVLTIIFTILSNLNVNLLPLFASAGVVGVALGFGAQNVVKDGLAGFFIIIENQYRVGDYIDVSGVGIPSAEGEGTVERISIRSTKIRDRYGNVHFIPNGSIVQVVNKTLGYSKVHFTFAVASGTDTDHLIEVINLTGRELAKQKEWKDKIVDPPHFSEIGKIGKGGFNVTISGTTEPSHQWDISSDFRRNLLKRMQDEGIEVIETIG
jgi:small conductance mechanosensitive channel